MIGLDSNILLRALMDDDPVQSPKARKLLAGLSEDDRGYINLVVLSEVTSTLARKFKSPQDEVCGVVALLLGSAKLLVESHRQVGLAIDLARETGCGFNDALIGILNRTASCPSTLTFDHGAPLEAGFALAT